MTVLRASNAPVGLNRGKPIATSLVRTLWTRPSDWVTFTTPAANEQKVIGTVAVWNQASNYIALACTTSTGQYTVDWGDGTSTNHNSNTTAEKNYVWGDISSGTVTSDGYRQAVITVTPTTGGATFSAVNLDRRHSAISSGATIASNPWLNIAIAAPNASTIAFAYNTSATLTASMQLCEQINIVAHSTTNMSSLFRELRQLQSVAISDTASVTDMSSMFNSCPSLQTVPVFNTAAVTFMNNMFSACAALQNIPELTPTATSSTVTNNLGLGNGSANSATASLNQAKLTGNRWTQSFQNCRLGAAQLDEMYTALAILNPAVTNVTGSGTVVTYTIADRRAFVTNRTVTITGVNPAAYNLTNVTIGTVTAGTGNTGTFTVNNAATGTYVSGGVAAIQSDRTITVTNNPGTTGDDPTIATSKGWTVTG